LTGEKERERKGELEAERKKGPTEDPAIQVTPSGMDRND